MYYLVWPQIFGGVQVTAFRDKNAVLEWLKEQQDALPRFITTDMDPTDSWYDYNFGSVNAMLIKGQDIEPKPKTTIVVDWDIE